MTITSGSNAFKQPPLIGLLRQDNLRQHQPTSQTEVIYLTNRQPTCSLISPASSSNLLPFIAGGDSLDGRNDVRSAQIAKDTGWAAFAKPDRRSKPGSFLTAPSQILLTHPKLDYNYGTVTITSICCSAGTLPVWN